VNETIRLLHITDTHLHGQRDAMMRGVNTFETFKTVIERVTKGVRKPDAVLATGDLVQDETKAGYECFRDSIKHIGVPVHVVPGNHDSPRIMAEILNTPPFHFCGNKIYGNWNIIMLNTTVRWDDAGRLEDNQLAILKQTLEKHSDKHTLIAMHHHPYPMNSQWIDGVGLRNSEELFAITDEHTNVRSILWGHVHQASDRDRNGVRMLSSPSTGSQFLPGSDTFMLDSKPPGYRWIELEADGSINTEIVWLS
jgi:Icc protein